MALHCRALHIAQRCAAVAAEVERLFGDDATIRAKSVVLSTGGFAFNRKMVCCTVLHRLALCCTTLRHVAPCRSSVFVVPLHCCADSVQVRPSPFPSLQVAQHAPLYAGMMPLGNLADDGAGIELGVAAGAALDRMGNCSAWK